ncbi:MAG: PQQ-dependent sugar dehydrogenase [Woeseia sp.]
MWSTRRQTAISVTTIVTLLALAGCGGGSESFEPPDPDPDPSPLACSTDMAAIELPPLPDSPDSTPPQIGVQQAFTQLAFSQPLAMLQAPGDDSTWYVVERRGTIQAFPNDSSATMADVEPFGDLTDRVNSSANEAGLLGMAFHPDFDNNRVVYLSYTRGTPLESVVSCFIIDSSTGNLDVDSEEVLLTVEQPQGNHNGGNVAFGPDGLLYIGFGDGGGSGDPQGNGQNTTNVHGTILRIDVDSGSPYAIPADNPFAGNTECFQGTSTMDCPEIFAWGFRNPWRFSFDRDTGDLWVGDVGQGSWEEVNRVEISENYGWNEREGAHCYPPGTTNCDTDNVDPITEYDHSQGNSVTGGYVYRGSDVPDLEGFYVFGDFGSGRIWAVPFDSPQGTEPTELIDTALNIASFAEGNAGELYVLHINGGTIHQIVAD